MFYVESNDIIQLLCFAFTHRVNSPWYIVWFVIGNVEFRLWEESHHQTFRSTKYVDVTFTLKSI